MRDRSFDHPDALLAAAAVWQDGVVSRRQLLDAGMRDGAIARRRKVGHLHPVICGRRPLAGVYAIGRPSLDDAGRQWAAHLACGPRSVLAGRTAADRAGLLASRRLEIIVPPGGLRAPDGIRVRRCAVDPCDLTPDASGLPTLTWARTCLDLAAFGTPKELRIALDRTVTLGLFDLPVIENVLARHPRAHGAPALRRALAEMTDDGDRSERGLEDDLLEIVLDGVRCGRLARPQVNHQVLARYRGDLVWPAERVIAEADGERWHAGPFARAADRERQAELEAAGWLVLRMVWSDVHDHPERTVARLVAALGGRSKDPCRI